MLTQTSKNVENFTANGTINCFYVVKSVVSTTYKKIEQPTALNDDGIVGIAQNDAVSGESVGVCTHGLCSAQFGVITGITKAGVPLTNDANGTLIKATSSSENIVAYSREVPTAAGAICEVFVNVNTVSIS